MCLSQKSMYTCREHGDRVGGANYVILIWIRTENVLFVAIARGDRSDETESTEAKSLLYFLHQKWVIGTQLRSFIAI